jgi:hypothetical protein
MHCATVPISFGCCEVNGSVADGTVWKICSCSVVLHDRDRNPYHSSPGVGKLPNPGVLSNNPTR